MSKESDVERARAFAIKKHDDQRWGSRPYLVHLDKVSQAVEDWADAQARKDFAHELETIKTAAYLHDVVEDTDATIEEIEALFGPTVARLVWAVTDEAGANRKERKRNTYQKTAASSAAVYLKLCDRIVNVENSMSEKEKFYFSMYRREHAEFMRALRTEGSYEKMWGHLGALFESGPAGG